MTISIVGHGYVGLVSACVFADFGNTVYVIGHTQEKLDRLQNGDPIIYEPGLKEVLEKNNKAGRLIFTTEYEKAISSSEIVFITVGTPPKENGEADLSTVLAVAEKIAKNLSSSHFTVVSCKSTVPVGTNKKIEQIIKENKKTSVDFAVASCPEFLREGSALHDTFQADRVVIGSESQKAIDLLLKVHSPIPGKMVVTDLASAELIKYTSNSVLAMKISFANLISFYCEKTGANVELVLDAVGFDQRIGRVFMDPGAGYGGSCFPKDVKALISTGKELKINTQLLQAVDDINERARMNLFEKIIAHAPGKNIAVWGLSFKPNTDDIRFAPSVDIIRELLEKGYALTVYDQEGIPNIKKIFGDKLIYAENALSAIKNADALVILTDWNEFKQADLKTVRENMKQPVIFDGRNIYNPKTMKDLQFTYISTGRESIFHS